MNVIEFFKQQNAVLQEQIDNLISEQSAKFTEVIYSTLATVLQHPELSAFVIQQGTPSFNDGDPCTFSVYNVYFLDKDGDVIENVKNHINDPLLANMAEELASLIWQNEESSERCFGDNAELTFTFKDGKIECSEDYYDVGY